MEDVFHHCNTFSCHSSDSVAEEMVKKYYLVIVALRG